jgi:hypothetical protein
MLSPYDPALEQGERGFNCIRVNMGMFYFSLDFRLP